jgi:signal transduction histidine kinase
VSRAWTGWIGEMLRPLAGDEAGARFWSRHVRVGVALTETSAAVVAAYVVLADRPHRALLLGVAAFVMLSSPLLLAVPVRTLSTGVRGPLIFYLWSISVTVVVAAVAFLDGGAESPLLWLLVLTMTFSALAYPPPGVLMMGALMVGAYLTVVIADDSLDPASLLVAAVLLSYTAMTSWVSRNHWDTRDQQLLLAARMAELDHTREEFVATTSHELRTPVASILGYVELLEDAPGGASPHLPEFLAKIRRNAERLQRLSEDLLFLCHWDSRDRGRGGEGEPARQTDLAEVAGRVHETMAPLAARERVALSMDLPPQPLPVVGAPDQLDRVVLNLVGNAVKYTPAGGRVSCRLTRVPGGAVIEVHDTGIGIAEDELEALFGRFFRASSAREQSIAGVGLGLSIVHEIVTSLGGAIDVSSRLGAGTTFVVRLPCASAAEVPAVSPQPPAPLASA